MMRMHRMATTLSCGAAMMAAQSGMGQISSTFDAGLEGWTAVGFDVDVVIGFPPDVTITEVDNSVDLLWDDGTTPDPGLNGNPGGFARFTDVKEEPGSFLKAPAAFTGDLSAFAGQTISYDHRLFNEGVNPTSVGPYVIVLISGDPNDLNAYIHVQDGPDLGDADTDWVNVSTTLDASNFVAIADLDLGVLDADLDGIIPSDIPVGNFQTTMSFEQVLADVTTMVVSFELVDNNSSQVSEAGGVDNVLLVPEPTSLALLGLGGLLIARRRR